MNKVMDKLFKGIDYFTGILTGLMVLFVFLNVVLRTFFNAGLTWSEELARYLFVICNLYRCNQRNACQCSSWR